MARLESPVLPPFLYRYRRLSEDRLQQEIESIENKFLWCANYKDMNDPMEGFYKPSRRFEKVTRFEKAAQKIYDIKQTVGICSFTDTHNNEIMWTHYADNYRGICIGYRPKSLIAGLPENARLARLGYGVAPPEVGVHEGVIPGEAARKILSHKKASWEYEREWRVFGPCGQLYFAGQCVAELRLGVRISDFHKGELLDHFAQTPIRIYQMTVTNYEHHWRHLNPVDQNKT
jgi:hypothetical protein